MNEVKVTVLMPAYNAGKYIAEAVRSVMQQTFTDFELLIVNDGSTDNTELLLQQFNDPRITIINQSQQGICVALNNGLHHARGQYIARFDADDICMPERLMKQFYFLDSHPDYVLVGSDATYMAEDGEYLFYFTCLGHTHEEIMQQLYVYCPFIHSGVMYRKQPVIELGGYNADAHNFEDYLLWVQLAKAGRYQNLQDKLISVRFNPASVTIDEKWRGRRFREMKKMIIERGSVTSAEGAELLSIIKSQDNDRVKKGAYNALCGKKFLVNNHQPQKARAHLAKAINLSPYRFDNYALYFLSFFPASFLSWLNRKKPQKI